MAGTLVSAGAVGSGLSTPGLSSAPGVLLGAAVSVSVTTGVVVTAEPSGELQAATRNRAAVDNVARATVVVLIVSNLGLHTDGR